MKNKALITTVAVFALLAFCGVSTAQAFVDPASLSLILGAAFVTTATLTEWVKHKNADAQEQKQTEASTQQKAGQAAAASSQVTETAPGQ